MQKGSPSPLRSKASSSCSCPRLQPHLGEQSAWHWVSTSCLCRPTLHAKRPSHCSVASSSFTPIPHCSDFPVLTQTSQLRLITMQFTACFPSPHKSPFTCSLNFSSPLLVRCNPGLTPTPAWLLRFQPLLPILRNYLHLNDHRKSLHHSLIVQAPLTAKLPFLQLMIASPNASQYRSSHLCLLTRDGKLLSTATLHGAAAEQFMASCMC